LLAPTGLTVYLEPGRFLVGSAGVLLTRVLYRKHSGGKEFVVVDAGMNDLVRPSHYQAYHKIVELVEHGRPEGRADVVGPVCETGDFLALDRLLPGLEAGEVLAVLGAGAYGFVMSSNYNSRPRPPEVIVDSGKWWVARPRETVGELFETERLSP
jgi:diaminopimelate decarboxylase